MMPDVTVLVRPERRADGHHHLAHPEPREEPMLAGTSPEGRTLITCEVVRGRAADDGGLAFLATVEARPRSGPRRPATFHDVVVGDDVARASSTNPEPVPCWAPPLTLICTTLGSSVSATATTLVLSAASGAASTGSGSCADTGGSSESTSATPAAPTPPPSRPASRAVARTVPRPARRPCCGDGGTAHAAVARPGYAGAGGRYAVGDWPRKGTPGARRRPCTGSRRCVTSEKGGCGRSVERRCVGSTSLCRPGSSSLTARPSWLAGLSGPA
jgi:hypothetical protein